MSELLRKLAQQLRENETSRVQANNVKCAQIMRAAKGLTLLRSKLGGSSDVA